MQEGKIPDLRFQIPNFKFQLGSVLLVTLLFAGAVRSFGQTIPPAGSEEKLIAVLKSDASHKEKADACRQLAIIGTREAVAPLAALLGDERLSHMARYGLEPISDPAVDDALRDALGKLKGRPLVGVIGSVGVRRDTKAVGQLTRMLQDSDPEVVQAAARALGKIGNQPATRALQQALPKVSAANQLALCEGLFRCAERLAAEDNRDEAIGIYDQLRRLDAPRQVRAGALRGAILARGNVGKIPRRPGETTQRWILRRNDGVALLLEHLRSDDYTMFSAAVQTAQELPGAEVTQALAAGLKQLPTRNQILVIQALGKRGDAAASPALFALAESGAESVRLAAIRALPQIGHASAVPTLVQLLQDSDRRISQAAQEGLAALPGREADAAVMAMFKSSDTGSRLTALEMMGRRRMVTSIPALLKAAGADDAKVRPAALKMVGELGGPNQLSALLDLLMDLKDSGDLDAAERALIDVCTKADDPQSHSNKLTSLLPQAQPAQKSTLLRVLGAIGGTNALGAVRDAVGDSNADVQSAAVRVLCGWGTPDAAGDLLVLARQSPNASRKTAALRGYIRLIRHESLSAEKKLAMCKQAAALTQRTEEKKLLLGVLATVPTAEALSMAMAQVENAATKDEACFAAVAISEKIFKQSSAEVIDALQKVMQTTANKDVIRRAKAILGKAKKAARR